MDYDVESEGSDFEVMEDDDSMEFDDLFTNELGAPISFSMYEGPEKARITSLIESNGGMMVSTHGGSCTIHLSSSGGRTISLQPTFSHEYIDDCIRNGDLLNLFNYRVDQGPAVSERDISNVLLGLSTWREVIPAGARATQSCAPQMDRRPTSSSSFSSDEEGRCVNVQGTQANLKQKYGGAKRLDYSHADRMAIVRYILDNDMADEVNGRLMWEQMASAKVCSGGRSWQSLKEHFRKQIVPRYLENMKIPLTDKLKLVAKYPAVSARLKAQNKDECEGDDDDDDDNDDGDLDFDYDDEERFPSRPAALAALSSGPSTSTHIESAEAGASTQDGIISEPPGSKLLPSSDHPAVSSTPMKVSFPRTPSISGSPLSCGSSQAHNSILGVPPMSVELRFPISERRPSRSSMRDGVTPLNFNVTSAAVLTSTSPIPNDPTISVSEVQHSSQCSRSSYVSQEKSHEDELPCRSNTVSPTENATEVTTHASAPARSADSPACGAQLTHPHPQSLTDALPLESLDFSFETPDFLTATGAPEVASEKLRVSSHDLLSGKETQNSEVTESLGFCDPPELDCSLLSDTNSVLTEDDLALPVEKPERLAKTKSCVQHDAAGRRQGSSLRGTSKASHQSAVASESALCEREAQLNTETEQCSSSAHETPNSSVPGSPIARPSSSRAEPSSSIAGPSSPINGLLSSTAGPPLSCTRPSSSYLPCQGSNSAEETNFFSAADDAFSSARHHVGPAPGGFSAVSDEGLHLSSPHKISKPWKAGMSGFLEDEVVQSSENEFSFPSKHKLLHPALERATHDSMVQIIRSSKEDQVAPSSVNELANSENEVANSSEDKVANSCEDKVANSSEDEVANSSEDEVANSSEDEVANSSEDEVANSSEDEVANPSENEVANSSEDEVANSSEDEVANSSEDEVADSSEDEVADSSEDEVANSSVDKVANSSVDKVANSCEDKVANSCEDKVANSCEDGVANFCEDWVANSCEDGVANSCEDGVANSCEVEVANSCEDQVKSSVCTEHSSPPTPSLVPPGRVLQATENPEAGCDEALLGERTKILLSGELDFPIDRTISFASEQTKMPANSSVSNTALSGLPQDSEVFDSFPLDPASLCCTPLTESMADQLTDHESRIESQDQASICSRNLSSSKATCEHVGANINLEKAEENASESCTVSSSKQMADVISSSVNTEQLSDSEEDISNAYSDYDSNRDLILSDTDIYSSSEDALGTPPKLLKPKEKLGITNPTNVDAMTAEHHSPSPSCFENAVHSANVSPLRASSSRRVVSESICASSAESKLNKSSDAASDSCVPPSLETSSESLNMPSTSSFIPKRSSTLKSIRWRASDTAESSGVDDETEPVKAPVRFSVADSSSGFRARSSSSDSVSSFDVPLPSKKTRIGRQWRKFTRAEDLLILEFILNNKRYKEVGAKTMWEDMVRSVKDLNHRSWHSVKERYRKTIVKHISQYNVSERDTALLTSGKRCLDTRCGPGYPVVRLQDASRGNDESRIPKHGTLFQRKKILRQISRRPERDSFNDADTTPNCAGEADATADKHCSALPSTSEVMEKFNNRKGAGKITNVEIDSDDEPNFSQFSRSTSQITREHPAVLRNTNVSKVSKRKVALHSSPATVLTPSGRPDESKIASGYIPRLGGGNKMNLASSMEASSPRMKKKNEPLLRRNKRKQN